MPLLQRVVTGMVLLAGPLPLPAVATCYMARLQLIVQTNLQINCTHYISLDSQSKSLQYSGSDKIPGNGLSPACGWRAFSVAGKPC